MMTREYINEKLKNNRYRNRLIHRYKVFFIFMFMVAGLLVPNRAYANMQRDITSISATPTSTFDTVSKVLTPQIVVQWGAPAKDTDATLQPETGVSLLPGEATANHQTQGYQILIRCLSNNSEWQQIGTAKATDTSYTIDSRFIKTGLIYQVDVRPYHYHSYQSGDETLSRLASLIGESEHNDMIKSVILDPEVKVEAEGTRIKVTFDDGGAWVNYTIACELYNENIFKNYNPQNANAIPRSSMTTSIDNGKTKLTYYINATTTDGNPLEAGKLYGILVKAKSLDEEPRIQVPQEKQIWQCATKAPFSVTEESNDYIKLTWKGLNLSDVTAIEIYTQADESSAGKRYATVYPKTNGVDFYLIRKPLVPTYYRIKVVYEYGKNGAEDIASFSESILYDPTLSNETPGKPVFYEPDGITKKYNTSNELTLNIKWLPYENATYDILVTDDVSILSETDINLKDFIPKDEKDQDPIRGYYFYETTEYITRLKEGTIQKGYSVQKLKENIVYYVRIIGKSEANGKILKSEPAIRAFYVDSNKVMFLPPTLPKPPLVRKQVTDKTATLEWNTTWWEVCALDSGSYNLNSDWSSMIYYIERGGNIFIYLDEKQASNAKQYGDEVKKFNISDDSSFRNFKDTIISRYGNVYSENLFTVSGVNYYARRVSFSRDSVSGASDVEYEGFYIEDRQAAQSMRSGETESQYIERYLEDYPDSWKDLVVQKGPMNQTTFNLPKENTAYWLVLRGYRYDESGNKVVASNPTIMMVTTTLFNPEIEPIPTVPTLILESIKDISAKFKWEYSTELAYEIRYSETEDVNTATPVEITNEMINDPHAPIENNFYVYEQLDLFPLTGYYIWIKAKQVKGNLESAWSNPLMFITTDLLPDPRFAPGGIGVAPQTDAITEDHITLEWSRVAEDIELDNYKGTKIIKNISYVLEIADNVKFLDSKEVECGGLDAKTTNDFLVYSKTMARALNLKSNTRYYVRIKTRITVKEANGTRQLQKESPWSIIKIFKTTSVNEYDSEYGDIDVPVPEKLLTVYNGNTVRINVNNDDGVITELIKQGLFDYVFDFSNEKSSYTKREAYIPLSVLLAMQNRDVNIVLKSKDTTVNVNSKAFKNLDYENLTRQGGVQGLVLTLNDDNSIYPINVMSRELGGYFSTKYGDYKTTYLEDYMEVLFDTTKSVYFSKNKARGVVYDNGYWKDAKDSYTLGYNMILKTGHMGKVGISY